MQFDEKRLSSPDFFAENRVPAHSDHVAYASYEELEAGETSLRYSLNGTWKFFHALNPAQVIPGFEAADYDCRGWADITVPAHIQMEGYGVPQYCNIQYPWDGVEDVGIGGVPKGFNPVACYVRYFYLPESMAGRRVFVSFQGAESCVAVWVNGHYIGFAADSFTPSEFELTDWLVEGENKLACRVYRFCCGSWLEDQDFMRFSGLYRDVYLWAQPEAHLADLSVKTYLDDDYRDAELAVALDVRAEEGWRARCVLKDADGGVVAEREGGITALSIPVAAPEKWSSERPYLYDLLVELYDAAGSLREVVRQKVGFRRFEIKDAVMYLNGVRVVFKGTNRHDYCAESGRAVPEDKLRRDLITMKRSNINAIRTSHYPNASALYRIADELGLYVIDENNMETHGVWDLVMRGALKVSDALPGDRAEYQDLLNDRVRSMFMRDRNHPCVLIWSCGNESFGGTVILGMSRLLKSLDDTRPVHYEGVDHDERYPETSDLYSKMYTPIVKLREFMAEHRDKPMILCEYTHAMGNSNGAMHKYTEYAYEEEHYQGGFIWDYLDQSVRVKDRYGRETLAYGGDYGDRPHDGNFCGNGILYGDGTPSPKIQEVRYNYQNIVTRIDQDTVTVVNRNMFTRTSAFDCVLTLEREGVKVAEAALETDAAPLSEAVYPLPFATQSRPGEYVVTASFRLKADTAWAERGFEVAFGQGVYTVEGRACPKAQRRPLRVVRGANNLGVYGDGFSAMFSYLMGGLVSYRWCGREMVKAVPMPNFWRAPNDNDRGNFMPQRYGQWKLASMYATHRGSFEMFVQSMNPPIEQREDGSVSIGFTYALPTSPAAKCGVAYTVRPCGTVEVTLKYDPVEGLGDMPEFGMLMRLDADYDRLRWYGLGPEENYCDRRSGARLGIWENAVKDNMARYLIPQECGNHTGVRWAEVTDFRGRGLRFSGDRMEFSALPYTPHELENALHDYELPPVHNTIVRASLRQMGVAGDDSWGARTHDEYLIDVSKPLEFTFRFRGI